jgi:eukaryotic-like serine/threonine-protein kinase
MSPDQPANSNGATTSRSNDSIGAPEDPRVASVLAAYLAELEAGRRPSRKELLESYPEIAESLADWFHVVEFVHFAAESGYSDRPVPLSVDALPADTMLGEYRLVREIGRGGMGIVYEAQQVSLGRRVALKVLSGTAALDPMKLQRFRVETQAVAQLNHPHIVPIFAVGSERGTHFYAMQFIDGPTLAEVIHQQQRFGQRASGAVDEAPTSSVTMPIAPKPVAAADARLTSGASALTEFSPSGFGGSGSSSFRSRGAFRALARLAIQAAEALAHAHAMGILHRDIKPSNLLVDGRGNLWVTDFGLARFQDEPGMTRTGDLLGTLRYIAPELVQGHRVVHDPRSDSYSLGATLYELLTLRPVFDGRDRQVLLRQIAQEEPVPPSRIDPAIPRDLETIVLKAMDKEPERRYATAQELADDLERYLEDKPIRARRPTLTERTAKWARRHSAVLTATAAVAFIALAIAAPLLWWEQRNTTQANQNLQLTFGQADLGFEQMARLSDELTMKGMTRYAEAGQSPEAKKLRAEFFQQAVEFYERLTLQPQIAKPMKALAFRRLGFARMVGMQDSRAEGDLRQSLALYEELRVLSPRDPEVRRTISEVHMLLGMYSMFTRGFGATEPTFGQVKAIDQELTAEFPDDPANLERLTDHWVQIAVWFENAGRASQSAKERRQLFEYFEKLAADASASPGRAQSMAASYLRLGRSLDAVGQFQDGQEALRRGLKLSGDDPVLLNDLAWSLALKPAAPPGEPAEAIDLAKRAVALKPNEGAFWNTLGLVYLRAGQWSPAEDALKKSMAMQSGGGDPSDPLLMAMISWRRGNKDAALDWYIQALDRLSRHPQSDTSVRSLRAEAESLLGRSKK